MPREKPSAALGLSASQVLATCLVAYQNARVGLGQPAIAWDELDEESRRGFYSGFGVALAVLDAGEEGPLLRWSDLARNCFFHACRGAGLDPPEESALTPRDWLPWEALSRHLLNALSYDPDEDGAIGDHEGYWVDWSRRRLEALAAPGGEG
jgi:hypothetical protein